MASALVLAAGAEVLLEVVLAGGAGAVVAPSSQPAP
jgi:hypothetical protein